MPYFPTEQGSLKDDLLTRGDVERESVPFWILTSKDWGGKRSRVAAQNNSDVSTLRGRHVIGLRIGRPKYNR